MFQSEPERRNKNKSVKNGKRSLCAFLLFCLFFFFSDFFPSFFRSRSKVLSRWLAGLPQQLALLGLRNPELSNQLIDIIHSAASRSNKELLQSLQATAARIYGKTLTLQNKEFCPSSGRQVSIGGKSRSCFLAEPKDWVGGRVAGWFSPLKVKMNYACHLLESKKIEIFSSD